MMLMMMMLMKEVKVCVCPDQPPTRVLYIASKHQTGPKIVSKYGQIHLAPFGQLPHNIEEGGDALKLTPWTNRQMVPAHAITNTQNTNDGTYENTQIQMCHCGLLWMMQIVDPMHA